MDEIDKIIEKVQSGNYEPETGINMEARFSLFEVEEEICVMCGEQPAKIVILDPNVFPNNDY